VLNWVGVGAEVAGGMIRGKHAVVAVPVLSRRWCQSGEPVEALKGRECDDSVGPWPPGLPHAARTDPV